MLHGESRRRINKNTHILGKPFGEALDKVARKVVMACREKIEWSSE